MSPPIFFGEGAAAAPAIIAFWAVLYLWAFSELWIGLRRRASPSAPSHDRGSRAVVIVGVWASVLVAVGLASVARGLAFHFGRSAFVIAGIFLMMSGLLLRWYAIAVLGRSFTVSVTARAGQPVVQNGPYRWIRHPSYSGSLLTILGVVVACANPIALVALGPALGAYAYRISVEEDALSSVLGEPYRAYVRRTRRLIPGLF